MPGRDVVTEDLEEFLLGWASTLWLLMLTLLLGLGVPAVLWSVVLLDLLGILAVLLNLAVLLLNLAVLLLLTLPAMLLLLLLLTLPAVLLLLGLLLMRR